MSTPYEAPLSLMRMAIDQAVADTAWDVTEVVLANAARFAREVLSPLNPVGDAAGSHCTLNGVVTPPGFREAYARFRDDGWPSLAAPEAFGGQGLPMVVAAAVTEMWGGANLAFAMCPESAVGAIEALRTHASSELQQMYLPKLASGEWTAAMCLSEPQAGSDLSTIRTRAEPDGAAWRLYGRKIYISWGDHDLSENIVHLVLARTPDAPAGTRGISLFLVPKCIPESLAPNDIHAVSVEHKMGIRASPTCVMSLGDREGARGWLVGQLHDGLGCMFTMMNHMRIGVGLHSTGLAERALQLAREYAHERVQGRGRPIIEHADVRRMLLMMKSLTHAARCLAYHAAATLHRTDLLTPVVKAWCSDTAVEVASLGVQIHGGMGYVDDSEISQVYRDARIGPIFEGTNYIQAQDLLVRKVLRDKGATLGALLTDIEQVARLLPDQQHALCELRMAVLSGCARMRETVDDIIPYCQSHPEATGAVAHHFLQWLGVLCGGWQWALAAHRSTDRALIDTAIFYAAHVMPRMVAHEAVVRYGARSVLDPEIARL